MNVYRSTVLEYGTALLCCTVRVLCSSTVRYPQERERREGEDAYLSPGLCLSHSLFAVCTHVCGYVRYCSCPTFSLLRGLLHTAERKEGGIGV